MGCKPWNQIYFSFAEVAILVVLLCKGKHSTVRSVRHSAARTLADVVVWSLLQVAVRFGHGQRASSLSLTSLALSVTAMCDIPFSLKSVKVLLAEVTTHPTYHHLITAMSPLIPLRIASHAVRMTRCAKVSTSTLMKRCVSFGLVSLEQPFQLPQKFAKHLFHDHRF